MKVGVNYTPRSGWFHSWLDFDAEATKADLGAIAELGLDHVRIFPLWPVLQPHRDLIRPAALNDVATVVELAGQMGLDVHVDVLNGHLSSFDFLPAWVTTWHRRNLFTDADVVRAQADLVTALAHRLRDLPAARGLGLGNEFSQFAAPRHPDVDPISAEQVDHWLTTVLGAAEGAWADGQHTHSYDDDLWFVDEHPFGPQHAVGYGALTTVHSWMFGKDWGAFSGDADAYRWFGRYLLELAAGWAGSGSVSGAGSGSVSGAGERGLWLQEIGAPVSHVPAADAPAFLTESLERSADIPGLEAITWWCSHDVSRSLPDFPELEYSLGLFDADGSVKPIGAALKAMVSDLKSVTPAGSREVIEFDVQRKSDTAPGGEVFAQWVAQARAGHTPALRPQLPADFVNPPPRSSTGLTPSSAN